MNGRGGRRVWLIFVVLLPAVRWFFRQRAENVVEEVGRRGIRLPGFELARRRALIHRLTHDPEVIWVAERYAVERGIPKVVVMARVERYIREIVPSFNAFLYFKAGVPLAGRISRTLYDVRVVSDEGLAALERLSDREASVVFVMNHRSNLDYVILAHLTADRTSLTFAAGEWARVPPIGPLVRAMGAFFVRRDSGDDLYRRVLERFSQVAVEVGLTQVIFPEGGLSRDGRPRDPRIGLLDYMLRRFDPYRRDILFIPVAVSYDWVLEDHALLQPGGPEAGLWGWGGLLASTASSFLRNLLRARRGGSFRLGGAALRFGSPLSVREYQESRGIEFRGLDREARVEEVKALAGYLMGIIREAIPDVAVPLVARALIETREWDLRGTDLLARARSLGRRDEPLDVEAALRTLIMRRLVLAERGQYRPAPGSEKVLGYYANSLRR